MRLKNNRLTGQFTFETPSYFMKKICVNLCNLW